MSKQYKQGIRLLRAKIKETMMNATNNCEKERLTTYMAYVKKNLINAGISEKKGTRNIIRK